MFNIFGKKSENLKDLRIGLNELIIDLDNTIYYLENVFEEKYKKSNEKYSSDSFDIVMKETKDSMNKALDKHISKGSFKDEAAKELEKRMFLIQRLCDNIGYLKGIDKGFETGKRLGFEMGKKKENV